MEKLFHLNVRVFRISIWTLRSPSTMLCFKMDALAVCWCGAFICWCWWWDLLMTSSCCCVVVEANVTLFPVSSVTLIVGCCCLSFVSTATGGVSTSVESWTGKKQQFYSRLCAVNLPKNMWTKWIRHVKGLAINCQIICAFQKRITIQ